DDACAHGLRAGVGGAGPRGCTPRGRCPRRRRPRGSRGPLRSGRTRRYRGTRDHALPNRRSANRRDRLERLRPRRPNRGVRRSPPRGGAGVLGRRARPETDGPRTEAAFGQGHRSDHPRRRRDLLRPLRPDLRRAVRQRGVANTEL
ncbi:hypothetical protein AVDCRST_MAG82-2862, partial [uncultured Rubrobacteraceae bacterium]